MSTSQPGQSSQSPSPAPDSKRELLIQWRDNAERAALTQRHESRKQFQRNVLIGVPVILLTVTSAVLSAVHADLNKFYDVSVVIVGVLSAFLASTQTFLGFDSRRSGSHQAAAAYSAVRRRIEVMLAANDESTDGIEYIRQELDTLGKGSPLASEESFQRDNERGTTLESQKKESR